MMMQCLRMPTARGRVPGISSFDFGQDLSIDSRSGSLKFEGLTGSAGMHEGDLNSS